MQEGIFAKAFKKVNESCRDAFTLNGDCILVEEVPLEEPKTKSGIVLATANKISQLDGIESNKPTFARVVAVGEGYVDAQGETIPLDCKVGDIILVGRLSVNWLSFLGPLVASGKSQLGITRESEIKLRFHGSDGYERVMATLSEANEQGATSS